MISYFEVFCLLSVFLEVITKVHWLKVNEQHNSTPVKWILDNVLTLYDYFTISLIMACSGCV